jgi:hypothetical protein
MPVTRYASFDAICHQKRKAENGKTAARQSRLRTGEGSWKHDQLQ